jgi:hypothetical protein
LRTDEHMNKRRNSFSEIKLLSAYLDDQLSAHQRAALESRLRAEPALRTELDELHKTRQMLRSLPRLRAPRSFTLSAQSVPKHAPARLPAFFGAVSALSSAVLILLVIGNLLIGKTAEPATLAEGIQAYPVAMEASVPESEVALSVQQETPGEGEPEVSLSLPPSDDTSRMAEPTPELTLAPSAAKIPSPTELPGVYPAAEEALTLGIQEVTTPTPYPTHSSLEPSPTPLPYEVALPGILGGASGEETLPRDASTEPSEDMPAPAATPILSTLFAGELILAGIALVSALTALVLLLRRRR